jgi:hypothetical protein
VWSERRAYAIEAVAGVLIVGVGVLARHGREFRVLVRGPPRIEEYPPHCRWLARSPLLGLEVLVTTDIVRAVALRPTLVAIIGLRVPVLTRWGCRGVRMSTVIAMESVLARIPPPCGMSWIASGTLLMGSDAVYAAEGPAHVVAMSSFYIDATAVSNAQYARFVSATGYLTVAERSADPVTSWRAPEGPGSTLKGREDNPVVQVAYEDALAYAHWAGKTLPTEAEWEYAAQSGPRAGSFAWGDVWEWTSDWYREKDTTRKVLKGGSSVGAPNGGRGDRPGARCAQRADTRSAHIGFRCVWRERFRATFSRARSETHAFSAN